jgi:dihydrofolate reductase
MSARVTAQQWMSIDGFAAGATGEGEIFAAVPEEADQASMQYNLQLLPTVAEVLLGRRTYESFAAVWPSADLPVATHVNTLPKVVFSRSLDEAPWGGFKPAELVTDAVTHVARRRQEADGVLLVWGSIKVLGDLLAARLVDELDLFVAPVALGGGTPLVPPGLRLDLTLVQSETWSSVLHLRYRLDV